MTALETLRGSLDYKNVLVGLKRADLWSVSTKSEGSSLDELADLLVNRTSVFVNPNKHTWRVWSDNRRSADRLDTDAWILVWDSEETQGLRALAELRGVGLETGIGRISKATLWRLSFTEAAKGNALDLADEMAVAVRRDRGLLANPHIHRWACGKGAISLEEAIACLEDGRESRKGTECVR